MGTGLHHPRPVPERPDQRPRPRRGPPVHDVNDPFLYRLVEQELIERYGINTVRNGGLKAYTTINPELQADAEAAVASCTETGVCYGGGGPVTGLASVDPNTGAILALASTPGEEGEEEFNYAWQAHRQPGSSFKPYVLATAIKQGIDPADTYYDGTSPMTLEIPGGGSWTVENDEPGGGTMSLEEATWQSINVVYAQLDLDVSPENVTETAHEMGIEGRSSRCPRRRSADSPKASRRSNRPTATRPSPTAASTTTRPRSAKSYSPTARSTKSTKKANASSRPARPTTSPTSSKA